MESPSMCERKHMQKPDQPIDYMKVEVKVRPLGDPNESFVLHSLRSSPALTGFDINKAPNVDWAQWSTVSSQKKLAIRVKVYRKYLSCRRIQSLIAQRSPQHRRPSWITSRARHFPRITQPGSGVSKSNIRCPESAQSMCQLFVLTQPFDFCVFMQTHIVILNLNLNLMDNHYNKAESQLTFSNSDCTFTLCFTSHRVLGFAPSLFCS